MRSRKVLIVKLTTETIKKRRLENPDDTMDRKSYPTCELHIQECGLGLGTAPYVQTSPGPSYVNCGAGSRGERRVWIWIVIQTLLLLGFLILDILHLKNLL